MRDKHSRDDYHNSSHNYDNYSKKHEQQQNYNQQHLNNIYQQERQKQLQREQLQLQQQLPLQQPQRQQITPQQLLPMQQRPIIDNWKSSNQSQSQTKIQNYYQQESLPQITNKQSSASSSASASASNIHPNYEQQLTLQYNFDIMSFSNIKDKLEEFNTVAEQERKIFDADEKRRRNEFEEKQRERYEYLQRNIQKFEEENDPYEILGIEKRGCTIDIVKKAYKKKALKYHPDKVGDKYVDKFQLITQSYIYLLDVFEKKNELDTKTTRKVEKQTYKNDIHEEGVENIHLSKDRFNINTFNEIFEKYKVPDAYEDGYGDILKEDADDTKLLRNLNSENVVFGKKFNKEIFNATFNEEKNKMQKNRVSTDVIEYYEPEALDSSNSFGYSDLGVSKINDFSGRGYTDLKKAHKDETLLINPDSVKYKSYRNIEELKSERSSMNATLSPDEIRRRQMAEQRRAAAEEERINNLKERDNMLFNQYNSMNKKFIKN